MLLFGLGCFVFALSGTSQPLVAGCHLDINADHYRAFHHGIRVDATQVQLERDTAIRLADSLWIDEDGKFVAVKNPLPPRCHGPNCQGRDQGEKLAPWTLPKETRLHATAVTELGSVYQPTEPKLQLSLHSSLLLASPFEQVPQEPPRS